MSQLTCPTCGVLMASWDHGTCSKCASECGCSFSPTSDSDFCSHHLAQLHPASPLAVPTGEPGPDDDARNLASAITIAERLKAALVPFGATPAGWDSLIATLHRAQGSARRLASVERERDELTMQVRRLSEACVQYSDRLESLIGTAGGSQRTMIVSTRLGQIDRDTRVCGCPWPRGVFVQGGLPVLPGEFAFVEAFPPGDGPFYRGEGESLGDAEAACWAKYLDALLASLPSSAPERQPE